MNFSIDDIAFVVRLVREAGDRWDEPHAWRERLLLGACELLDGNVGSMHAIEFCGTRHRVHTLAVVGLSGTAVDMIHSSTEFATEREPEDVTQHVMPGYSKLIDVFARDGWATKSRSELIDEATFHQSPMYTDFRKPLDCDDYVVSLRKVDVPQRAEIIDIDRPHGAPPFGPREVSLLELLHSEISPLVGVRLTTEEHLSRDGLSRRLNETLNLLLEGSSEKEAAIELGIRPGTVHDYVTMLYKHFAVRSRAELLAYFIRRRPEKKL